MFNISKDQLENQGSTGLFFGITIALLFIVICLIVRFLFYTSYKIVTIDFAKNECYIKEGFDLKWQHSVEKQWWIESYEVKDDVLLLTDAYLETFGAGTPSTEVLSADSEKYPNFMHYPMNVSLPYLNWMISPSIQAQIITKERHLPIYKWIDDYTNIYIHVNYQNLWAILQQDSCNDYNPKQPPSNR